MLAWIRVIICSGPRQVINAFTLYSVYDAKLQIKEASFEAGIASFFDKIKALATEETQQAVILCGMLFTVVVWIFSFLSLLLAALFFVLYLWSAIPRADGGLTGFCERKVNKRLKEIVSRKINKAMADQERKRRKAELKAAKENGDHRPLTMKPSIPILGGENMPEMPPLSRADTFASFSEKPSRPTTPGSFEMNALGQKPPMPSRSGTTATSASQFSSNASLMGGAAEMGRSRPEPPTPTVPRLGPDGYPLSRTATGSTNRSYGPGAQIQRMDSNGSSLRAGYTASPAPYPSENMPSLPPRILSPGGLPNQYGGGPNQPRDRWPAPGSSGSRPTFDDYSERNQSNRRPYPGESRTMDDYSGSNQPRDRWPTPGGSRTMDDYSGSNQSRDRWPNPGGSRPALDDHSRLNQSREWSPDAEDRTPTLPNFDDHPGQTQSDSWFGVEDRKPTLPIFDDQLGQSQPGDKWLDAEDRKPTVPILPTLPTSDDNYGPNQPRDRRPSAEDSTPTLPAIPTISPFDDDSSGRGSPAPSVTSYHSGPTPPPGMGPSGYPIRSATNPMPPRGPPVMPPPRTMTAPTQPFHQPTGSNGSLRSTPSPPLMPPPRTMTAPIQSYHQPTGSNGSARSTPGPSRMPPPRNMTAPVQPYRQTAGGNGSPRSTPGPYQPYHQPSASNSSSLRNMVNASPYQQSEGSGEYEGESRPNPMTGNIPRGPPRRGYGNGDGWNQDLERGPRY